MKQSEDIVIIGAGPAGAHCAFELAKQGIESTILDGSHPREKPCGGGISPLIVEKFPFVNKFRSGSGTFEKFRVISPSGQTIETNLKNGFITSRRYFDEGILNMAVEKGAKLIKEKVIDVQRKQEIWEVKTSERLLTARILVGADGVNSITRRRTIGPMSRENLMLTYGYMAKGPEKDHAVMKILADVPGVAWVFPTENNSSIGIASELSYGSVLKRLLDDFIRLYCPPIKIVSKYAAMVPSARNPEFFAPPCAGENWALLGDAAGHADPISGGGILYALLDGQLAAEAIRKKDLKLYDRRWREEYGGILIQRSEMRKAFYDPLVIELAFALDAFKLRL